MVEKPYFRIVAVEDVETLPIDNGSEYLYRSLWHAPSVSECVHVHFGVAFFMPSVLAVKNGYKLVEQKEIVAGMDIDGSDILPFLRPTDYNITVIEVPKVPMKVFGLHLRKPSFA